MEENLRIIISGGGTGGHIFPAVSIANAIKEQHPEAEILFVYTPCSDTLPFVTKIPHKGLTSYSITAYSALTSLTSLSASHSEKRTTDWE